MAWPLLAIAVGAAIGVGFAALRGEGWEGMLLGAVTGGISGGMGAGAGGGPAAGAGGGGFFSNLFGSGSGSSAAMANNISAGQSFSQVAGGTGSGISVLQNTGGFLGGGSPSSMNILPQLGPNAPLPTGSFIGPLNDPASLGGIENVNPNTLSGSPVKPQSMGGKLMDFTMDKIREEASNPIEPPEAPSLGSSRSASTSIGREDLRTTGLIQPSKISAIQLASPSPQFKFNMGSISIPQGLAQSAPRARGGMRVRSEVLANMRRRNPFQMRVT
jgi:hypothetical protein